MENLKTTSLLSFEISNKCNLQKLHPKCPINLRQYKVKEKTLNKEIIVKTIKQAMDHGFTGMVAFHYYNEPLLNKDLILEIINEVPTCKYLLWTNALLLDRKVENNDFLKKFSLVCITCYNKKDMPYFETLKNYYKNIDIFDWELDDRLEIYNKKVENNLSCKRPLFEIPIDYYGNIHLCCMDWNNSHAIGNIFKEDFIDILNKEEYKSLIKTCKGRLLNNDICPKICKTCDKMWVSYPKYYD